MFCAKLWQKAEGTPFLRSRTSHRSGDGSSQCSVAMPAGVSTESCGVGMGRQRGSGGVGPRLSWEAGTSVDKVQLVVSDWIFED